MSGIPTSPPPQVRVVYAECNTPGTTGGAIDFDTFYDSGQAEITDVAGALAAFGLSYAAGVFTALQPVVIDVLVMLDVAASPGGTNSIGFSQPGFLTNQAVAIANPNTLGNVYLHQTIAMAPVWGGGGLDNFSLTKAGVNTPLDYVAMQLIRLV